MNLYITIFRKYKIVPILLSLSTAQLEVIQAEERQARISVPFNYTLKKDPMPKQAPGSFTWKALPLIASWLFKNPAMDMAQPPIHQIAYKIDNLNAGKSVLKETLGVISEKPKSDLIIITYFSRLCHQDPWEVEPNTRNRLMGLPACAPSQDYSVLPFRIARQRRLRESHSTPY